MAAEGPRFIRDWLFIDVPTKSRMRFNISGSPREAEFADRSGRRFPASRIGTSPVAASRSAVNRLFWTPIHECAVDETGGPGSMTDDEDDAELRRADDSSDTSFPIAWAFK